MAHVSTGKRKEATKALLRRGPGLEPLEPLRHLRQLKERQLELDLIHFSAASRWTPWPVAFFLRQKAQEVNLAGDTEVNTLIFDTTIMTAAGRGNAWDVALQLGLGRWDVVALNSVLAVASWVTALTLLSFGATRRLNDAVSKNSVAKQCLCGEAVSSWCRVLSLLQGSRPGDLVAATGRLGALGGRWEKALQMLDGLDAVATRPNSITFNAALTALEAAWQKGLQLLCAAKLGGLRRDVVGYSALLSACQKRWREALQRWSSMVEVGVLPNAVTFTALLSAMDFAQRWHQSLRLLRRHPALRSPLALNAALSAVACGEAVCWRKASQLLMQCRDWQMEIDALGVAHVARAAVLPWRDALKLLKRSPRKALPGVFRALCAARRWEEALHLLHRMDEMQDNPEATSFGFLVDALESTCRASNVTLLALLQRLQEDSASLVKVQARCLAEKKRMRHFCN